jgi:hypothetical protein
VKKWILMVGCVLGGLHVQGQLSKQRLFKVDPLSWMFKEFRVAVENRILRDQDYFWYLAPYGYHHFWSGRTGERYGRPTHPQRYSGVGFRIGARRYIFPQESSPHGFFVQAHAGFRHIWMQDYSPTLVPQDRTRFMQMGLGGTVGYQWIAGPRKDFVYGFIGGVEFYADPIFPKGSGHTTRDVVRNWYEFPFLASGHSGIRLYLGIEVGFAFLQKHLHW